MTLKDIALEKTKDIKDFHTFIGVRHYKDTIYYIDYVSVDFYENEPPKFKLNSIYL